MRPNNQINSDVFVRITLMLQLTEVELFLTYGFIFILFFLFLWITSIWKVTVKIIKWKYLSEVQVLAKLHAFKLQLSKCWCPHCWSNCVKEKGNKRKETDCKRIENTVGIIIHWLCFVLLAGGLTCRVMWWRRGKEQVKKSGRWDLLACRCAPGEEPAPSSPWGWTATRCGWKCRPNWAPSGLNPSTCHP